MMIGGQEFEMPKGDDGMEPKAILVEIKDDVLTLGMVSGLDKLAHVWMWMIQTVMIGFDGFNSYRALESGKATQKPVDHKMGEIEAHFWHVGSKIQCHRQIIETEEYPAFLMDSTGEEDDKPLFPDGFAGEMVGVVKRIAESPLARDALAISYHLKIYRHDDHEKRAKMWMMHWAEGRECDIWAARYWPTPPPQPPKIPHTKVARDQAFSHFMSPFSWLGRYN